MHIKVILGQRRDQPLEEELRFQWKKKIKARIDRRKVIPRFPRVDISGCICKCVHMCAFRCVLEGSRRFPITCGMELETLKFKNCKIK